MPALATLDDHPDNPVPPGAEAGTLAAADGRRLRWARFAPLGSLCRGTVLILQGRAEFVERWFETVRDLQVRGFGVVAFDWRGQGGSERLGRHPRMGHVRDFRAYELDLDAILRKIVAPLPGPLHVLAHSTGALVAVAAAPRLNGLVRRMVLTAPFLGLGEFGVPERVARGLAVLLRGIGLGGTFVPGGGATAMLTTPFARNRLTSDPVRHARGADQSWRRPDIALGSPSVAWLAEAFAAQKRVFRPEALEAWRLPTLVFACGADRVVSNTAIERFVAATRTTELIVVPGSRHELLHERDRWREQFWAAFDAFVPGEDAPAPLPVAAWATAVAPAMPVPTETNEPEPEEAARDVVPASEVPAVEAPLAARQDEPEAEAPPPAEPEETASDTASQTPMPRQETVTEEASAPVEIAAEPTEPAASAAVGEEPQHGLVEPGIAGGDDAAAVGGAAAGPGGDDAAGPLDDRDQGDDVVGLEPGLDHDVGEAGRDHAVGVAVGPVARQPNP